MLKALPTIAIFVLLAVTVQFFSLGYASDQSQTSDEAAHFVTALMIHDYVVHALGSNPVEYAKYYYGHFPRVAIGHWPPLFETVLAISFVFARRAWIAILFQGITTGVCAAIPALIVARQLNALLGFLSGIAVLCAPQLIFETNTIMADNLLAVLVILSALAWWRYFRKRDWLSALWFSLSASAAIFTKGSGVGLVFLPLLYLLIRRDLRFLLDKRTLASAALVGALTAPWYIFTYKLQASGFVYSWGIPYSSVAAPRFAAMFVTSLGLPAAAGFIWGAVVSVTRPSADASIDIAIFVAASLSMFLIVVLVPADISARYLIPAIPAAVVVSVYGLNDLSRLVAARCHLPNGAQTALAAAAIILSSLSAFRPPHLEPLHSDGAVDAILSANEPNSLILVSGGVRAEGSLIARFAEADPKLTYFVVRATKVFGQGNFMGTDFRPRFLSEKGMSRWLANNEIGWIVLDTSKSDESFAHSRMLESLMKSRPHDFQLVKTIDRSDGQLRVYRTPAAAVVPSPDLPVFKEIRVNLP